MGRILVISNACFSKTDANGSTLAKMFKSIPKEKIAQFFVYGQPDQDYCSLYYQITDRDAFCSLFERRKKNRLLNGVNETAATKKNTTRKKTPLKYLLREFAWKYGGWNNKYLDEWIRSFSPDCIFLFLADNAFLPDFARCVAKRFQIPIVAYTTEDYYFKEYNYITKQKSIMYWLFHRKIVNAYDWCEPYILKGLFNTPVLQERFQREFQFPCECAWAQSDIDYCDRSQVLEKDVYVSYLGNLGLNRHKALMEIADSLNTILPGTKLHVYGNLPENIYEEFTANKNIQYEGFVDRKKMISIIHSSNLLIHAEYNDSFNCKDLESAFSTKIADSICSGTPLLLYAPEQLAETRILKRFGSAFVVTEKGLLNTVLYQALFEQLSRTQISKKAKEMRTACFTDNSVFIRSLEEVCDKIAKGNKVG